ncbi:cartilage matrix protein-like [Mercenaria mercenaria]|uniref:cartilage matrix protein-like n=1 Tax=Mercenaria mercenaria TaxID=6596 RepID=UPI00234E95EE|nr:cartilage matrix protein-like [Mercenaria mercenaria]
MDLYLTVFIMTLLTAGKSFADECNSEPADVVFVLDSSYSIWPPDFDRELKFAENVIKTLNIGPGVDNTRVGVVTFGHGVWPKFYLDSYLDTDMIIRAVRRITYGEGKTTNTGDALTFTRDVMMSARAGGRSNVTKIVIVVSDGRSQKTWFTQEVAKTMQDNGMFLFAISIGFKLDHKELAGIASDPDNLHYFSIDEHSDMTYIKRTIDEKVCQVNDDAFGEWNFTDNTAEFKANEEVLILDCSDKKADIFFMIDASYSIQSDNFGKEMEFVKSVVDFLDIGANKTRVGAMTFSDTIKFHAKLEYNLEKEEFISHLNSANYMGGGTDTASALRHMREEGFFASTSQVRNDAARILIVMTDGLSITPDVTTREAKLLKKMGVQVFSIGIGSGIDKRELEDIASDPTDKFFLHVDNFGALDTIKVKLAARSCTVPPTGGFPFIADQAVCHPMRPTDLIFVYDAQALGSWRSQSISQFISKSVAEFSLATDDLRVGREIENCPSGNIPIGSALHNTDLDEVRYQTFTDMIRRVTRSRMSEENGGRKDAAKMAVIFVDSSQRMNYETFMEARKLKERVDFFYVVTVGHNMQTLHLTGLAGEGHFISVKSYEELHPLADKLMSAMCDFFFTF